MFSTTQWTVVFNAATENREADRPALGALIEKYWRPLYFVARRQGLSPADAEDATQGFLADIVQGDLLEKADPARGRFRAYLLTAWKRYLIDVYRKEKRLKRGGDVQTVSLDTERGERQWLDISVSNGNGDTDRIFNRGWASSLVEQTIDRLRAEYSTGQRLEMFNALLPSLTSVTDAASYRQLSSKLSMSVGAAKVALHRLRQRFAQTLRTAVEETIDDPADLESEMKALLDELSAAPMEDGARC